MHAGRARRVEAAVARVADRAETAGALELVEKGGATALRGTWHVLRRDRAVLEAERAHMRARPLATALGGLVLVIVGRALCRCNCTLGAARAPWAADTRCARAAERGRVEGARLARRRRGATRGAEVPSEATTSARRVSLGLGRRRIAQMARSAGLRHPVKHVLIRCSAAQFDEARSAVVRAELLAQAQRSAGHEGAERRGQHVANETLILDGAFNPGLAR